MKALSTHSTNTNTITEELSLGEENFKNSLYYSELEEFNFKRKFDFPTEINSLGIEFGQIVDFNGQKTSDDFILPEPSSFDFTFLNSSSNPIEKLEVELQEDHDTFPMVKKEIETLSPQQTSQPRKVIRRRRRQKKLRVLKEYMPPKAKKATLKQKILSKIGKKLKYCEKDIIKAIPVLKSKTSKREQSLIQNSLKSKTNFSSLFSGKFFVKSPKDQVILQTKMEEENEDYNTGLLDCVDLFQKKRNRAPSTASTVLPEHQVPVRITTIRDLLTHSKRVSEDGEQKFEQFHSYLDQVERMSRVDGSDE